MSGGGVATATRLLRAGVCSDEELGEVLAVNPCHAGNQPPARRPTAWRRAKTAGGGPPKPCSGGRCCPRAKGLHGDWMVYQLCALHLGQQSKLQPHDFVCPLPHAAPLPPISAPLTGLTDQARHGRPQDLRHMHTRQQGGKEQ